ncbi:MAG: hypothetical protein JW763_06890, partial [candidate division Zixibacteria bacterium]|nr:hypothetical protein [candidate division Zixibacteria bacterium]
MAKRLSALVILTLIIGAFLAVSSFGMSAADKNESFAKIKIGSVPLAKVAGAERTDNYIDPSRDGQTTSLGYDAALGSSSVGLTVGITTYDYQHNCRLGRQVDWRGTQSVHFDWMVQSDYTYGGDRGTAYEAWDPVFADLVFKGPDGGTDVHPRLGSGVNYSGYVGLDVAPDGRVVIVNHHDPGYIYSSTIWFDFSPLGGFFSPYETRLPDSLRALGAADTSQWIWPSMDYHVHGTDTVVHIFTQESLENAGDAQKIRYYRHVGGINGDWDLPYEVDTVYDISQTVVASRVSEKVGLVWVGNPPEIPGASESGNRGLQRVNDLFYQISTDMGASWGSKYNVTGYDSTQPGWVLHGDVSALMSTDDKLHVIYDARETAPDPNGSLGLYQHFYGCRLFHWAEGQSPRVIKDANWDPPATGPWCHGGAWNEMSIVKMMVSECDGKFYALFVQFNDIANGIDDDCHNRAFANSEASGTANGELYISVSSNAGLNWDIARNLTNTYSSHCDSAPSLGGTLECFSEMWPSMSRYGMQVTTGDFSGVPIIDPSGSYTGDYFLDVL